jgi:hypothetical protein
MPSCSHPARAAWLLLLALSAGCATTSTSNTARTSTEQLLVANAVDQALDKVNFTSFSGYKVFLQDKYIDCVDKNYVIASSRHRLFAAGAELVDAPDKAEVVVELRAGAVGTGSANSFVGTPEIVLPGMMTVPEIHFMERKRQEAVAKLGLVAYDPKTGQILGEGGLSLASAKDSNWFVAGIGPYQNGEVRKEVSTSTTGIAAKSQGHLSHTVAFAKPPVSPAGAESTQIAAEAPAEKTAVKPASHDSETKPAWAKARKP